MKPKLRLVKGVIFLLLLSTLNLRLSTAFAQGTAFTYQGRLNSGSSPGNGLYDLRFKLFVDPLGNTQTGSTQLTNAVPVTNGLFMVTLDFGAGVFNGTNCWLEVDVKTNGAGSYVNLSPLQALTPAPFALFAENVGGGGLSAGTYGSAVTFNNAADQFSGTFTGNGASVSNVNAVTLNGLGAGGFWQLGGNNVVDGQFLGSTNNHAVEIWVNGTRALRFEPNTNGAPNIIGGATVNFVDAGIVGATIAGGGNVSGNFYLGGGSNHVAAIFGTIAGGRVNTVAADHAFIGGGISNTVQAIAYDSVIGGGVANVIQTNAAESVLGGGTFNTIQQNAEYSFLGGGDANSVQSNAYFAVLTGGYNNSIQTNAYYSVIGGGYRNTIQTSGGDSVIGGGGYNSVQAGASYGTIAGGEDNTIQSPYSTIAGGLFNTIQSNTYYAIVGGGYGNVIVNGSESTIGGGDLNSVNGYDSTIGGGRGNVTGAFSPYSTVAGGEYNTSSGWAATVAGGLSNSVFAYYGTAGGGQLNTVYGYASTVPGGNGNWASGSYSFAAGNLAQAVHNGAFVWSDASATSPFSSTTDNQFSVRATGGVRFVTGGQGLTLDGQLQAASLQGNLDASYVASGTLSDARLSGNVALRSASLNVFAGDLLMFGGAAYHNLSLSGGNAAGYLYGSYPALGDGIHLGYNYYYDAAGIGHFSNAGGLTSRISAQYGQIDLAVGLTPGAAPTIDRLVANGTGVTVYGTFNNFSDRNAKQDFAPVSPALILAKVAQLPLSEWSYKEDVGTRHVGPMAQDFHSLFHIGTDDRHIAPIDEGGVALAAIQGLNQKVEAKDVEIRQLKQQNEALKKRLDNLEQMVKSFMAKN